MTVNQHPNVTAKVRETTANSKMSDSIFHRFKCPVCGVSKKIAGRESRGWKRGFRCSDCKEKRDIRIETKRMEKAA
jgi:predicted RNA-binding Zn-ribbon protein involved in translation (DUF1610 family)